MHTCKHCGKRRGPIERLFALDDEYCDECLFDIIQSIRERYELPVRVPQRRSRPEETH